MKPNLTFYFVVFLLLIAIVLVVVDIKNIKSEGYKCIQNALSYGVQQWSKINNANLVCSCDFDKPNLPTLFVNKNNVTMR